jgi:transposase
MRRVLAVPASDPTWAFWTARLASLAGGALILASGFLWFRKTGSLRADLFWLWGGVTTLCPLVWIFTGRGTADVLPVGILCWAFTACWLAEGRWKGHCLAAGLLAKRAVDDLTCLCQKAREAAVVLERYPDRVSLPGGFDANRLLSMAELAEILCLPRRSSLWRFLKQDLKVLPAKRTKFRKGGTPAPFYRVRDIEAALLKRRGPLEVLHISGVRIQMLSESLCVVSQNQFDPRQATFPFLPELVSNEQIARALGASRRAVQAWCTAYNRGGLEALPDRPHPGRTPILPRDQEARFLERIDAPPRPEDGVCELRGADIRRILEEEFAARYTPDGVYKLLHRLGYSDLMPRPQHPDSCPEAQEFFKEIVVEHIAAIAEQHPDAKVEVWHQDEARFGQKGTLTRVWARRGSRPRRVRQEGRESLYVLTAVCAASGAAVGLVMPELNTAVVNLFLEQFSRELPTGVHAVLIWDGAGFHTGLDVVVPSNVSLIQLPPYSPELNPVENLWHYLRAHHWSNRAYRDYDELQEEAVRSLCAVRDETETIKTVCNAPYLQRSA